jgi:hypothetical protein
MGQHLVKSTNLKVAAKMLRSKLAAATRAPHAAKLQPVPVRAAHNGRQPIHPAAWLRQQKRTGGVKWYSSSANLNAAIRRFLSSGTNNSSSAQPRFDRSKFPISNTSRLVSQLTGRAPFASTLRPNLTGGALPRTAGGYALLPGSGRVGGARYFSHTPVSPAQVVQNVSQAMRAFWLSGQRMRYDGIGPDGERRYRAVSALQEEARLRMEAAAAFPRRVSSPGAFVDFRVSPTLTALSPLGGKGAVNVADQEAATLHAEGFLDVLSVDFARALKDLAAVMTDLKCLAGLGDMPVRLEKDGVLRVRFPGLDAETVERLCDDVGVKRGVVGQDPDFDASAGVAVALRFPFAPDASREHTITSPGGSLRSRDSGSSTSDVDEAFFADEVAENPWLLSEDEHEEGYESMSPPVLTSSGEHCSEDFEGLEGIYRFLEECDRARRRS